MLAVVSRPAASRLDKPADFVRGQSARLPWAWDGLCFAVPMTDQNMDGLRDVVSGQRPTTVNGLTWGRDYSGNPAADIIAVQNDSTAYMVEYPHAPAHAYPSTELTMYVRVRRIDLPDSWGGYLCKVYQTGAEPWDSWVIQGDEAALGKVAAGIAVGSTQHSILTNNIVLPTTEYASMFLRWRSGEAMKFEVYGVRGQPLDSVTYGSTVTGSIAYPGSGQPLYINAAEDPILNGYGSYSQVMVWERKLTDAEVAALVADPFGWYAPRRATVTVSAPFPVGPGMAAQGLLFIGPSR